MASVKLELTVPDGATGVLIDHIVSVLGEDADGLTPKQAGTLYLERHLQSIYHRVAKAKGGRDYNATQEAAREARASAAAADDTARLQAETDAEDAAKVIWS